MAHVDLHAVLASAARLQQVVPDAVLVGGTAAAFYARHRESHDHDHVLADLQERYLDVLDAVETTEGWVTSVRASSPPLTLLGSLGGIEAGLRQLRRVRPLEVEQVKVGAEHLLTIPTAQETLRIKAYLIIQRNQTRDYLDVAALADRFGTEASVDALIVIDEYYRDRSEQQDSVLTAVMQRLAEPNPRDARTTAQLASYKNLDPRWHHWNDVVEACRDLADAVLEELEEQP